MPVLGRALAAQNPQQPPAQEMDPVAMLMDEYQSLRERADPKPMFTPEQRAARVSQNQDLTEVGLLGSLAGNQQVNNVGGQVLKRALQQREDKVTQRGIMNPLTGEENLDPEYVRANAETKRGQILQRALAFQQSRLASEDRRAANADRLQNARDIAQMRIDAKAAGGGGEGKPPNLVQVKDDNTGKTYWANPKTGELVGEITLPGGGGALLRPDKMSGGDDKEITGITTSRGSVGAAAKAVEAHPEAFGPAKGLPDQMGPGMIGSAARYIRDNKSLSPDQVAARAMVYNNVSAVIKERAGTAQSAQELKRLQGFLPSEFDSAQAIQAKLAGFNQYLDEKEKGIRVKYAGPRPVQHQGTNMSGAAAPANAGTAPSAAGGGTQRLKFNPATGDFE